MAAIELGQSYRFEAAHPDSIHIFLSGKHCRVLKQAGDEDGRASFLVEFEPGRKEIAFDDELVERGEG